jgi:hypothetical protein
VYQVEPLIQPISSIIFSVNSMAISFKYRLQQMMESVQNYLIFSRSVTDPRALILSKAAALLRKTHQTARALGNPLLVSLRIPMISVGFLTGLPIKSKAAWTKVLHCQGTTNDPAHKEMRQRASLIQFLTVHIFTLFKAQVIRVWNNHVLSPSLLIHTTFKLIPRRTPNNWEARL